MKRSRLTRKTPIKRISAKRRQQMARTKPARDTFRAEFRICMLCCKRKATDVARWLTMT